MVLLGATKQVCGLEHAGLTRRTVDGRFHRCTLDPAAMRAADEWLAHYRAFWDHTLDALTDYIGEDPR
jgi:hypothetical protein